MGTNVADCKSFQPMPPQGASLPQASPHLHLLKTRLPVCTAARRGKMGSEPQWLARMQPPTYSPEPPGLEVVRLPVILPVSPPARSEWKQQPREWLCYQPIIFHL